MHEGLDVVYVKGSQLITKKNCGTAMEKRSGHKKESHQETSELFSKVTPRKWGTKVEETTYQRGGVLNHAVEDREREYKHFTGPPTPMLRWKIMEKAKTFICACLNGNRKGTIYFGIGDPENKQCSKLGEIIGLQVENLCDDIGKAFQDVLDYHIKSDGAGPLQKGGDQNCANMVFVPVVSQEGHTGRYVIEIDVYRDWIFCKDHVYYCTTWSFPTPDHKSKKKALKDYYTVNKGKYDKAAIRDFGRTSHVEHDNESFHIRKPLRKMYEDWKRQVKLGVVDPVEKPNKRQSNPELLDSLLLLDIGSVEKVNESFNKSAGQVERHRASKDNMDLPVPEVSTPSTSGQKDVGKQPLMTEQESDSNTPLGKEEGHVSNNAAALVTGPRLLTPPVSYVASNSSTEKMSRENEVVWGDGVGIILEELKKLKEFVTERFAEVAASMETIRMGEARRRIETESQAMRISHLERRNEKCNRLSEECNRLRKECEWLKKERHRLKETIWTLRRVIDQLDSQNDCMIADNQTSDSATLNCSFQSTSGERGADDVAHISGYSQRSDSGDSTDEVLFEDAVEYL